MVISYFYFSKVLAPLHTLRCRLLTATGVVFLCSLVACASLRSLIGLGAQKPRVQLASIAVVHTSLAAIDLQVKLQVDNPNDVDLHFSQLKYHLSAAGLSLAAGNYGKEIVIPATSTAFVKLPLTIDAKNAMQLADQLLKGAKNAEALIQATVIFASTLGDLEVNFEERRPLHKIFSK